MCLAVTFGRFAAVLFPAAGLVDCALSVSDALTLLATSSRYIVASVEEIRRRKAGRRECVAPKAKEEVSAAAIRRRAATVSPPIAHHRLKDASLSGLNTRSTVGLAVAELLPGAVHGPSAPSSLGWLALSGSSDCRGLRMCTFACCITRAALIRSTAQ